MPRFDLNISILLREYPFLERLDRAARLQFGAVEFWWPSDTDLSLLVRRVRDAGLAVALINFDGGDLAAGDRGLLNDPQRVAQFRRNVPIALDLAQQLGCTRLNALVGRAVPGRDREVQLAHVRDNLEWACEQAQAAGITVVVESLNTFDSSGYLLSTTHDTLGFLDTVNASNLRYQYDVYHMQRMEGNITATLETHIDRIGHIQIADVPGRHEPGTGELNIPFILQAIDRLGYDGYVGLEYNPSTSSEASFGWLPRVQQGNAQ